MWEISVTGQTAAFFYSAALGAILGFFYDMIRATRKAGANSFIAVFIGDILFWVLSAVLIFLLLMAVTNGEIRGYILVSCFSGFILYLLTLGRIISVCMANILILLKKTMVKASRKAVQISGFAQKRIGAFLLKTAGVLKRCFTSVKKLLKKPDKMLYTDIDKDSEELSGDGEKG
ncbi:MAG: spore cortex biosynthesis protein YabQ [Clostridia bacterium]|nr:spore cortex biosynthesis protein YabQ [Clostridia bacterium]